MTKEKKTTDTKVVRIKIETFKMLEEIAKGFETPDEVIKRLIVSFKEKGEK